MMREENKKNPFTYDKDFVNDPAYIAAYGQPLEPVLILIHKISVFIYRLVISTLIKPWKKVTRMRGTVMHRFCSLNAKNLSVMRL